jgi:hypothetical protein
VLTYVTKVLAEVLAEPQQTFKKYNLRIFSSLTIAGGNILTRISIVTHQEVFSVYWEPIV